MWTSDFWEELFLPSGVGEQCGKAGVSPSMPGTGEPSLGGTIRKLELVICRKKKVVFTALDFSNWKKGSHISANYVKQFFGRALL